jgi:hypothetical protein
MLTYSKFPSVGKHKQKDLDVKYCDNRTQIISVNASIARTLQKNFQARVQYNNLIFPALVTKWQLLGDKQAKKKCPVPLHN